MSEHYDLFKLLKPHLERYVYNFKGILQEYDLYSAFQKGEIHLSDLLVNLDAVNGLLRSLAVPLVVKSASIGRFDCKFSVFSLKNMVVKVEDVMIIVAPDTDFIKSGHFRDEKRV